MVDFDITDVVVECKDCGAKYIIQYPNNIEESADFDITCRECGKVIARWKENKFILEYKVDLDAYHRSKGVR